MQIVIFGAKGVMNLSDKSVTFYPGQGQDHTAYISQSRSIYNTAGKFITNILICK